MKNLLSFFLCLTLIIATVGCASTIPTIDLSSNQNEDMVPVSSEPESPSLATEPIFEEEQLLSEEPISSQAEPETVSMSEASAPSSSAPAPEAESTAPSAVSEAPQKVLPSAAQKIWNLESDWFHGFQDGWLYYRGSDPDTNKSLYYRTLPDNTQKQFLDALPWSFEAFAIHDDWIYYSDQPVIVISCPTRYIYNGAISRIRTDGSQQARYPETVGFESTIFFEDWIYYFGRNTLSRIRTDGTEHQKLLDVKNCDSYVVGAQGIFFEVIGTNSEYEDQIIRCDLDGSNPTTLLYEPECSNLRVLFVEQDYLYIGKYYSQKTNDFQGYEIGRMRFDGTDYQIVSRQDGISKEFVVQGGWIYYVKYTKNAQENNPYSLCRVRLDGSDFQTLYTQKEFESWEIVNDQIYFLIRGEDRNDVALHRIALDGTNHTILYQQTKEDLIRYHDYYIEDDIPYVVLTDRNAVHDAP